MSAANCAIHQNSEEENDASGGNMSSNGNVSDRAQDVSEVIGVHTLDLSGFKTILELLKMTPQQVRNRQNEQNKEMGNIYNMGSGFKTAKFDEAAEEMFKRTYPEIAEGRQTAPIFIPETFIPRVPLAVDVKNYKAQFKKLSTDDKKIFKKKLTDESSELSGDMVEKEIYENLKIFYAAQEDVVVLQGADLLKLGGKRGDKQESDFLVINKKLMYIMIMEAKLTLSKTKRYEKKGSSIESALKQITTTKKLLETYFSKELSDDWSFIGVICYEQVDEKLDICQNCTDFVMKVSDIQGKMTKIESMLQPKLTEETHQNEYKNLIKNLIFTIFANPGPITHWKTTDQIAQTVCKEKGQGEYRSILFWTPSQFQILQLDGENHPIQKNVLFISSMSTGKTECMKGMVERLLKKGQKCNFILYNQRCPKKTLLQIHLENYFEKEKNLVFNFLNSDDHNKNEEQFDLLIRGLLTRYPGYNTFIDELTIGYEGSDLFQSIVKEMSQHPNKPCLWLTIAGIGQGKEEDFSMSEMQSKFPDFFIPSLRFPLRNCKQIVKYVLGNKKQIEFDHDGDSGTSYLDLDVPDNLMDGLPPIDVGEGHSRKIKEAMEMVDQRQGKQGVAILFNYWSRIQWKDHNRVVKWIMDGLKEDGREAIHYSCEYGKGVSEERLAQWIKNRGDVDLVADLCVTRGWDDNTVLVVDCNEGRGVENLYMRAISNLIVIKIPTQTHLVTDMLEETACFMQHSDSDSD